MSPASVTLEARFERRLVFGSGLRRLFVRDIFRNFCEHLGEHPPSDRRLVLMRQAECPEQTRETATLVPASSHIVAFPFPVADVSATKEELHCIIRPRIVLLELLRTELRQLILVGKTAQNLRLSRKQSFV